MAVREFVQKPLDQEEELDNIKPARIEAMVA